MDDRSIVDLFFARDEQAIVCASEKYAPYCAKIANNILGDSDATEECLDDTWFAAWNRIPPAVPDSLGAFLAKITRNIALDRLDERRAKKRGSGIVMLELDELEECIPSGDRVDEKLEEKELAEKISAFLSTLPERESDIFLAHYFHFFSATEIAHRTDLPANYIRTVLHRTRKKLKRYLKKENV